MDLKHSPTKILVTGNSGSGKSTLATAYVLNAPQDRVFVYDHEGELAQRLGISNVCYTPDQLQAALEENRRFIVYDPSQMYPGDTLGGFNFFGEWVFNVSEWLPGTKLFFSDELQTFVDIHDTPWALRAILETGRRRGIDTLLITQQPNVVHNRVRNQLTEVVTFCQVDDNAIKFLEGLQFDAEEIRALPEGHFVLRNLRRGYMQRGQVEFTSGRVFVGPKTYPGTDTGERQRPLVTDLS